MRISTRHVRPRSTGVAGNPAASVLAVVLAVVLVSSSGMAQTPISRSDAIAAALARSPQAAVASAEQSIASAAVSAARQWENPVFSASISKDAPNQHYTLDIPMDLAWQRSPRIAGARAALDAARLRYAYATRAIAFDVDTAYTRAQVNRIRQQLSARTARDADSLLRLTRVRRDAGDASDLDVELATIFAGQTRNAASTDSVAAVNAAQQLQVLIGNADAMAPVVAVDSLTLEAVTAPGAGGGPMRDASMRDGAMRVVPLPVSAAAADVRAATYRTTAEQRRRVGAPSLMVGVETANPGGAAGPLGLAGISLPLPLFNRNRAAITGAQAELARAEALLSLTRMQSAAAVQSATRDADAAYGRAVRSATLVASANRVAAMSLLAYREGASTLLVVLEAQRSARETLGQYFDDVAAARVATSLLRLLTSPTVESTP